MILVGFGIKSKMLVFTNDTKLASILKEINSNFRVQSNLDFFIEWPHK